MIALSNEGERRLYGEPSGIGLREEQVAFDAAFPAARPDAAAPAGGDEAT